MTKPHWTNETRKLLNAHGLQNEKWERLLQKEDISGVHARAREVGKKLVDDLNAGIISPDKKFHFDVLVQRPANDKARKIRVLQMIHTLTKSH